MNLIQTYKDSKTEIWETDTYIFGITSDCSFKRYYNVSVREKTAKGKTIATRCTYEKAMSLIKNYQA